MIALARLWLLRWRIVWLRFTLRRRAVG